MNLYQMGFFRIGQQGINAGWQVVSPSVGISDVASQSFESIASEILNNRSKSNSQYCRGIFFQNGFVYFVNVNFVAKGEDERGVSYVHCYCFTLKDYFELAKEPSKLAGVANDVFPLEYDSSIDYYPVVQELPYQELNLTDILNKYGINMQVYREMVLAVISAIAGKSHALCIKKSLNSTEYVQFYSDMLYAIMMGIPDHLRTKLTSLSIGGNGRIAWFVSDKVEGDNYIDLDQRVVNAQYSALAKYEFTLIYNNFVSSNNPAVLKGLWKQISDQIDNTIDNPVNEISIDVVEGAYQAVIKKSEAGGIDAAKAVELLTAFTGHTLLSTVQSADYMAELLRLINKSGVALTDRAINNRLSEFYVNTEHEEYKKQLDIAKGLALLKSMDTEQAYDALDDMRKNYPAQYANVYNAIKTDDIRFAYSYYLARILPEQLNSFAVVEGHLQDVQTNVSRVIPQDLIEDDYMTVLSAIMKISASEFAKSATYMNHRDTKAKTDRAIALVPAISEKLAYQVSNVKNAVIAQFWDTFKIDWFEFEESAISGYKKDNLLLAADSLSSFAKTSNAKSIYALCCLKTDTLDDEFIKNLKVLFFTKEIQLPLQKKFAIRNQILTEWMQKRSKDLSRNEKGFDALLILCFDFEKNVFDIAQFAKLLNKVTYGNCFENTNVNKYIKRSSVLKAKNAQDLFKNNAEEFLIEYKNSGKKVPKDILKGIKKYVDVLNGKELLNASQQDTASRFFMSLYREMQFVSLLGAFALIISCMNKYMGLVAEDEPNIMLIVFIAVLGLAFVAYIFVKCFFSGSIDNITEDSAINNVGTIILYFTVLVISIAALVVLVLKDWFIAHAIFVIAYLVVSIVLMIISDSVLED